MADSEFEELQQKHKNEKKDLLAKIQSLKHSIPKGDKKKKRDITLEIAKLESQQEKRHQKELEDFYSTNEIEPVEEEDFSTMLANVNINDNDLTNTKTSRSDKRKAKKAAKEQDREKRIAEGDAENVDSARNMEAEKIKNILMERHLDIFEITPDGHCLYKAVEDQLRRKNLKIGYQQLRRQASDYMLFHRDDFLPFLVHVEKGELYTPDEFNKYCKDVATTSAWGGQLELQALSHVLSLPIEVIQADSAVIKIGEQFPSSPILLSYHHHAYSLGEHYNSLIPLATSEYEQSR